jgi:hypothetical protein
MRDPKRLFEEAEPFQRSLLRSGRGEPPPGDLENRILGLIAAAPAVAPTSAPKASPVGKPSFVRLVRPYHLAIAMAVAGAGAAISSTVVARNDAGLAGDGAPTSDVSATRTPVTGPVAPHQLESTGVTHTASAEAAAVATSDSRPSAPAATRPQGSRLAVASGPRVLARSPGDSAPPEVGSSLERELELLETVKASLRANATSDATRALDLYDAEFPRATLRPEATVLRIRTLLMQGNRPAAQKLADDYLDRHPSTVHGKRIRGLLAE